MSYPDKYVRDYDFQAYQNLNPNRPLPGDKVNAELNSIVNSTDEIVDFLKTSLRSDGAITNGAVGLDQLDTTVKAALGDTSGVEEVLALLGDAQTAATASAASATASASSASAAAGSASTAGTSATNAATSETNAAASAASAATAAQPANVTYNRGDTGSNNRTLQSKLRERASVFDFIPSAQHAAIIAGSSTYDCTADFQAAIDAVGGKFPLYVPNGKYKLTSTLKYIPSSFVSSFAPGIEIIGDGPGTILDNQVAATSRTDTFDMANGSAIVTVHRTAHGKAVGQQETWGDASATVGGLTINGTWNIESVPTADTFTFKQVAGNAGATVTGQSVTYNVINPLFDFDTTTAGNFQQFTHLRNLYIQNNTSPSKSVGVRVRRAYKVLFEDLWIRGMTRDGILVTVPNGTAGDLDGPNGVTLRRSRIENCLGWGINCDLRSGNPGNNELSYLILDDTFVSGCGTASASLPPPSGGIRWKGQVLRLTNGACVTNENTGLYVEGAAGLSNTMSANSWTWENNKKRPVYITGLQGADFNDVQFYNNDSFVATSAVEMDATNFVISNIELGTTIVRATSGNNPYTAFKASGANLVADTIRLTNRKITYQTVGFPAAGQAKTSGWGINDASFSAKKSADQTGILSATDTKVTYPNVDWDIGGFYDSTNSRWTPPAGKVKLIAAAAQTAAVVDQATSYVAIYKNGSLLKTVALVNASGTGPLGLIGTVNDTANGTDYYEVFFNGGGAGNKTVQNAGSTYFQGQMVS